MQITSSYIESFPQPHKAIKIFQLDRCARSNGLRLDLSIPIAIHIIPYTEKLVNRGTEKNARFFDSLRSKGARARPQACHRSASRRVRHNAPHLRRRLALCLRLGTSPSAQRRLSLSASLQLGGKALHAAAIGGSVCGQLFSKKVRRKTEASHKTGILYKVRAI